MENIEVGLRIRPLNQNEIANFEKVAWLTKNNDILSFDIDHHENVLKLHKTTQINLKNPINFSDYL